PEPRLGGGHAQDARGALRAQGEARARVSDPRRRRALPAPARRPAGHREARHPGAARVVSRDHPHRAQPHPWPPPPGGPLALTKTYRLPGDSRLSTTGLSRGTWMVTVFTEPSGGFSKRTRWVPAGSSILHGVSSTYLPSIETRAQGRAWNSTG